VSSAAASISRSGRWFDRRWVTLIIFTLLSLVCYIDRFITGALLNPIKGEFHITDEQLGRINLIFIFAYILIVPLAGYVGDRHARKWYIFFSLLIWSAASIGSGWAAGFGTLLIWRAAVGIGEGVFSSLSPGWIADIFGTNLRSFAFAVIQSSSQIGAWIAYAGGGAIAAAYSWHQAFFVAGVPGLVLAFAVIFMIEPKRGGADGYTHAAIEKPSGREILQLFRESKYLLYLGGYFFRMMGVTGVFFWGAVFLHRHFGVDNREATSFIGSAYLFAGVPGIFFAGVVAGRLARRIRGTYAFWLVGSETLSAICVSIVLLYVRDLTTAKLLLLGQMFFAGNSWGMINPLLFDFVPVRVRSLAVSTALAFSTAGTALLGNELIGLVSDHVGIKNALLLAPAGYLIAASLWLLLGLSQAGQKPDSAAIPSLAVPVPGPNIYSV
jgi:predicted MFS family arabinose efflux permease